MQMITKDSLSAAIDGAAHDYSEPFRDPDTDRREVVRFDYRAGANHLAPALLVLAEALEEAKLAIDALKSTQKKTGLGSVGEFVVGPAGINHIDEALTEAAKLLDIL